MYDESYLIFDENLEPYAQYPGAMELFEELKFVNLVAGSIYFGSGVACSLARGLSGRVILGTIASGAKYKVSCGLLEYVKANERVRNYRNYLQTMLTSGEIKK